MEVVVKTGALIRAKLQSNHHQQPTRSFVHAGFTSCRPTNIVRALKEESGLAYYMLSWGSSVLKDPDPGYCADTTPTLSSLCDKAD